MYSECNLGKTRTYAEVEGNFLQNHIDYYIDPSSYRIEPFKIFGNLYYVGDRKVCAHLIDTGDGLILFDSGYRHALHLLLESIRSLGFDPSDIRYIIHSHGHFDHFGGSCELRRMYGCKVMMSRTDTDLLREDPERALLCYAPQKYDEVCMPDIELNDNDVITLGNTSIRCILTPGHTGGTMTFFFDASDGEKTYKVGYMGGVGFLSIYKDYCKKYGLPLDMCQRLKESICRVWDEPVDIVIGNHPNQNCTIEKRLWMLENPEKNPFINSEAWHIFLTALEKKRLEFESKGY